MSLPAHFWVWILTMTMHGQPTQLQAYAREDTCKQDITAMHANSSIKVTCERVMVVK